MLFSSVVARWTHAACSTHRSMTMRGSMASNLSRCICNAFTIAAKDRSMNHILGSLLTPPSHQFINSSFIQNQSSTYKFAIGSCLHLHGEHCSFAVIEYSWRFPGVVGMIVGHWGQNSGTIGNLILIERRFVLPFLKIAFFCLGGWGSGGSRN